MQRPLGISTSMLDKDFDPAILAEVAQRGITHLELVCTEGIPVYESDEAVEAVLNAGRQNHLTFWSVHAPFGGAVDLSKPEELARRDAIGRVLRAVEVGRMVGAGLVVIHAGIDSAQAQEHEQRRRQAIRSINELVKRASQAGLAIAVEYLPNNKERLCNSAQSCRMLLDLVDGQPGICFDTNHANLGESLSQAMTALGDRITTLHISDNDGVEERHTMPGTGTIDWAEFLRLLDEIDYQGPLMYEASNAGDSVPERLDLTVRTAREFLAWQPA